MREDAFSIDEGLVRHLVATQFPQWAHYAVRPVAKSGWDNRTFHLGEDMLVRLPSAACYAAAVEKEHQWLARLAFQLPLAIPVPLVLGKATPDYPSAWSIYAWLVGETVAASPDVDLLTLARSLAQFLLALQRIDSTGGPLAGSHNFYRGGNLLVYDEQTRQAITRLSDQLDAKHAIAIWESALATSWQKEPVWVHGDISAGNLLVRDGRLSAVIDFGQLAIGDPACDLTIAWTLFEGESRAVFQTAVGLDEPTWARGRAWALWKALVTAAGFTNPNNFESERAWSVIRAFLM